jgi:hypothetical protein
MGEAEALAHAERVLAHRRRAAASSRPTSSMSASTRSDGTPDRLGRDGERLASAAPGVLGGGVEQDPDAPAGVRQVAIATAEDPGLSPVGLGEADEHPHRRGLAGAVGAEEARDGARLASEADVETTVRPPSRFVSPSLSIMARSTRPFDRRPCTYGVCLRCKEYHLRCKQSRRAGGST